MDIPKRTVSFLGDSTDWRLITANELAELEARKPQVPAEVIAEARRWAQNLRMWPRTATLTEDGFRLIPEDCLRACSAAFDALLAAVEPAEGCPCKSAEWEMGSWSMRKPGDPVVYRAAPNGPCPFDCGAYLPPTPTPDVADMTLDEQIDELATYMPEQMPVLALLLDETTLPKVLQSFRDRECGS